MLADKFVYHLVPDNFQGNEVLPASILRVKYPKLVEQFHEKYQGREDLMQSIVYDPEKSPHKFMGDEVIKWTEVAFFSSHNPKTVYDLIKSLELPHRPERKAFKIPLSRFSQRTFVWMYTRDHEHGENLDQCDCLSLADAFRIIEQEVIPIKTVSAFQQAVITNQQRFLFEYVPHIMTPDPVSIKGCEIFTVS